MATVNLGRIKPVYRGVYNNSTGYVVDDMVQYTDGTITSTYICTTASTGNAPSTSGTPHGSWSFLAKGVAEQTVDLTGLKSDITALAIREATNENSAAFNLPSSFIETFTDDTNLGTQTSGDRLSNGSWATVLPADGIDDNTVLMFHFDNNLTDSSQNGVTLTANGSSVTFNTSIKKFGTHSVKLGGSNEYLSTADLDTVDDEVTTPTTGDFTIDYWLYQVSYTGADRWFSFGNTGTPSTSGAPHGLSFGNGPDGGASVTTWNLYNNTANPNSANTPNYTGQWTHHVAMREGGHLYILQDGVWKFTSLSSENSGFSTNDMTGSTGTLFIGARSGSTSEYVNGYYDDFRYSNVARYDLSGKSVGDTIYTPRTTAYAGATANATGTLIQSANAVSGSRTKVGGTMLYKDNAGTNTLGTDLKIYFTANGGTNWTEAASYTAITPVYSTGVKMVRLGETTVTGGTDVRYKAVFANQALSSKEAQLHAIGINY